jgi:hypothetical protein
MIPPSFIMIKISDRGKRKIWLPLPVFLLWIPLLFLIVLLSPFLVVLILLYPILKEVRNFFNGAICIWNMICSLRGFTVDIKDDNDIVYIKII